MADSQQIAAGIALVERLGMGRKLEVLERVFAR